MNDPKPKYVMNLDSKKIYKVLNEGETSSGYYDLEGYDDEEELALSLYDYLLGDKWASISAERLAEILSL